MNNTNNLNIDGNTKYNFIKIQDTANTANTLNTARGFECGAEDEDYRGGEFFNDKECQLEEYPYIANLSSPNKLSNNNNLSGITNLPDITISLITKDNQEHSPSQNNSNSNSNLNKNKKKAAFSLIELSIVLIIIGLLVAGITGGASLIKSAKMRAFMNEVNNYKIAYNTYYAATGKMLGEGKLDFAYHDNIDFDGSIWATYIYTDNPFYNLYTEGIIDFKIEQKVICETREEIYKCGPKINSLGSGIFVFSSNENIKDALSNNLAAIYEFPVKDAENIDKKYDDGIGTSGTIYCSSAPGQSGSYSISGAIMDYNTIKCKSLIFTLDI